VVKLILTHISSRYSNAAPLLDEAQLIFRNTCVAEDLLEIEVPYRDRLD